MAAAVAQTGSLRSLPPPSRKGVSVKPSGSVAAGISAAWALPVPLPPSLGGLESFPAELTTAPLDLPSEAGSCHKAAAPVALCLPLLLLTFQKSRVKKLCRQCVINISSP